MLAEKDCPREQRFLFTDIRFGSIALDYWKAKCRENLSKGLFKETALTQKHLNWEASGKEIALFTHYAYADLKIPKSFSCVFDLKNPERVERTDLSLEQSMYEAWYPVDYLDQGHKHLCIFKFQSQIPALLNEIENLEQEILKREPTGLTVGICQWEDFPLIKKSLEDTSEK